ncbi:MAG: substrate-binding domain-containing protein, partial [Steroidobacteraceae bacterium]
SEAIKTAGASVCAALQVDAITMEQSGYEAACKLLARNEPFDAIVAASDLIAIGALRALQERRIDVPGAVSVVGFDDIPAASLANPPLTTVMQDTRLQGRRSSMVCCVQCMASQQRTRSCRRAWSCGVPAEDRTLAKTQRSPRGI